MTKKSVEHTTKTELKVSRFQRRPNRVVDNHIDLEIWY